MVKFRHPEKTLDPNDSTLAGIVMLVRFVQNAKVHSPIYRTPSEIDIEVKFGQR